MEFEEIRSPVSESEFNRGWRFGVAIASSAILLLVLFQFATLMLALIGVI